MIPVPDYSNWGGRSSPRRGSRRFECLHDLAMLISLRMIVHLSNRTSPQLISAVSSRNGFVMSMIPTPTGKQTIERFQILNRYFQEFLQSLPRTGSINNLLDDPAHGGVSHQHNLSLHPTHAVAGYCTTRLAPSECATGRSDCAIEDEADCA